jgi:transcriptional regulator with XRE-family HTH domain
LSIGESIRKARNEKNFTQAELSAALGKTVHTIQRYESGKIVPPLEVIEKMAEVLETTPFKLMGNELWDVKFPNMQRDVSIVDSFIAILTDIYGYAELKIVKRNDGSYSGYYLVGKGKDSFILDKTRVDNSYTLTKEIIKPLIEKIKDIRPEDEIINEILNGSDNPSK